jgi:hypothetical protein
MIKRYCVVCLLLAILLGGMVPVRAADAVAMLEPVQGLVQLRQGDSDWQSVTHPTPVGQGISIRTDARGIAYLTFFEGVQTEILPDSVMVVNRLSVENAEAGGPFEVSMAMMVGETLNRIDRVVDASSRYEVQTPGAVMTVRGTVFRVSVSRLGNTTVSVSEGTVHVTGIDPAGNPTGEQAVEAGHSLAVSVVGKLGKVETMGASPQPPPEAPLAPASCGDGVCEANEQDACPLDCLELPACGDGRCDRSDGEDAVTCPADCVPPLAQEIGESLHFYWGGMRCDIEPSSRFVQRSLLMHWGIGCFDSAAQASAHPHPADYQLTIDGQPADMGSLRQHGPDVHSPDCPWGWTFELGPVALTPGEHSLTLTERTTDTWWGESGGHDAGEVNTLSCQVTVIGP